MVFLSQLKVSSTFHFTIFLLSGDTVLNRVCQIWISNDKQLFYRDSIIFLAASAYFDNCFLASPVNFGFTKRIGMSSMMAANMAGEISGAHLLGNRVSDPVSTDFLSINHLLNDSRGASIAAEN